MMYGKLKSLYIDLVTTAGSFYKSFELDVIIPTLEPDSEQPIAKFCSAELVHVGKFAGCTQKNIFNKENSSKIVYENRYALFI